VEVLRRQDKENWADIGRSGGERAPWEEAQFSPDGQQLLTWGKGGAALIWNVENAASANDKSPRRLFSRSGLPLVASDWSYAVTINDDRNYTPSKLIALPDGTEVKEFAEQPLWAVKGACSPDNSRVALVSSFSHEIRVWGHAEKKKVATFQHDDLVNGLRFNKRGSQLLTWSDDRTARIWDTTELRLTATFYHKYPVKGAIWTPDEERLVTWTQYEICVWMIADQALVRRFDISHPTAVCLAEDGKRLVACDRLNNVKVYELTNDSSVPIKQRIRQLEVDTGTRLDDTGTLRVLRYEEWCDLKKELAAGRVTSKSSD
jgi:WD40 repeat protein